MTTPMAMVDEAAPQRRLVSLEDAYHREERDGLGISLRLRYGALGILAILVVSRVPWPAMFYYLTIVALFCVLGIAQYFVSRRSDLPFRVARYVLVLFDVSLLAFALIVPNPLAGEAWPVAVQLRLGNFDLFFVFLAFSVLSYSPGLTLWVGLVTGVAWSIGVMWILSLPDTFTATGTEMIRQLSMEQLLETILNPNYVSREIWIQHVTILAVVAGVLAVAVLRSRRLAFRQAQAASERASLARYFSPNLVEHLAQSRTTLDAVRVQPAAVLFADIVGFTKLCEELAPDQAIDLLRNFHARMARTIFRHDGTLNKYIGDAVMATFGAPESGLHDATRSLNCALDMIDEVKAWNAQREIEGVPPVAIGVGIHFGEVILGDVGDERCLEFAVVGDTVNVSSRIERLTRKVGAPLVVSDDVVAQIKAEDGGAGAILNRLMPVGLQEVRGRAGAIEMWVLKQED